MKQQKEKVFKSFEAMQYVNNQLPKKGKNQRSPIIIAKLIKRGWLKDEGSTYSVTTKITVEMLDQIVEEFKQKRAI